MIVSWAPTTDGAVIKGRAQQQTVARVRRADRSRIIVVGHQSSPSPRPSPPRRGRISASLARGSPFGEVRKLLKASTKHIARLIKIVPGAVAIASLRLKSALRLFIVLRYAPRISSAIGYWTLRQDLTINFQMLLCDRTGMETLVRARFGFLRHGRTYRKVNQGPINRVRHARGVQRLAKDAGLIFLNQLGHAANIRGDGGDAAGHGFKSD